MPGTNFKNGVSSYGIPLGLDEDDLDNPLGKTIWVQSGHSAASDNNSGERAELPMSTLQAAEGKVLANAYDRIFLLPGHAETISAAAGLVFDVAGVKVTGKGRGTLQPKFTFDTGTDADLDIDAANVILRNIRFISDIAALAAPIDVNAAGCELLGCEFYANTAAKGMEIAVITDATANYFRMIGCRAQLESSLAATTVTDAGTEFVRLVGADFAEIRDNLLQGLWTTSCINGITTASLGIQIIRNGIYNGDTTNAALIIDLVAACTGLIDRNYGFCGYNASLAAIIDPASCGMGDNRFSNVVTEAAGLIGTAST